MLSAGQPFRGDDVRHPIVVTKGQTVTMQFDAPGVELTAMGRAMSEGGVGDTVTVQNPASFRMITAVVIGAGTVRATGPISAPNNTHRPPIGSAMLQNFDISPCSLTSARCAACSAVDRIENIGEAPKLAAVGNPAGQQIVAAIPRPAPITHVDNSLWQPGAAQLLPRSARHPYRRRDHGECLDRRCRQAVEHHHRAAAPIATTPT